MIVGVNVMSKDPAEMTILELISEVDEFLEMSETFNDDDLDTALGKLVKLTMKPDVPPQAAITLIVQLESIAAKLYIQASYAKNVSKPKVGETAYVKKNMYFSIAEALRNITAALKYAVKSYG